MTDCSLHLVCPNPWAAGPIALLESNQPPISLPFVSTAKFSKAWQGNVV
jgi:hypothetical protein